MHEKRRILFVLPSLTYGGLERVQVTLANALAHKGFDVTVMAIYGTGALTEELDAEVHFVYKPFKKHLGSLVRPIRHRYYDDGQWETRTSPSKLHRYYIGNEYYDIEIGFFRGLPLKIVSGCQNDRTIRLAWVHTDFRNTDGYQSNFLTKKDAIEAYQSYDKVVCVSKEAMQGYIETLGDTGNQITIYNMLPVNEIIRKSQECIAAKLTTSAFNIVIVGRLLDKTKGQTRLINAVSRLHSDGIDVGLTIVGEGEDHSLIQKHIESIEADQYVQIVGNQPNPYPLIKKADLMVCASYFEGYNLTVAEALICGTPVLSTDCTGPREILENGKYGMIVDNSEDGLYEGMKNMIKNKGVLAHYCHMTEERKDFFNEDEIMNQIIQLFRKGK